MTASSRRGSDTTPSTSCALSLRASGSGNALNTGPAKPLVPSAVVEDAAVEFPAVACVHDEEGDLTRRRHRRERELRYNHPRLPCGHHATPSCGQLAEAESIRRHAIQLDYLAHKCGPPRHRISAPLAVVDSREEPL